MEFLTQKWIRLALFNLLFVAFWGMAMRYKMAFELQWVNQKHLQLGHSYFAFFGWITHTILVLMVNLLPKNNQNLFSKFVIINLLTAWGMFISFSIQGYSFFSISFLLLSILNIIVFGNFYINNNKDLNISQWLVTAFFSFILAALGAICLSIMMISNFINQTLYLASEYFFLHFLYNGWFFFGSMALMIPMLSELGLELPMRKKILLLFGSAIIPTYGLSVLWLDLPLLLYFLILIFTIFQFLGLIYFVKSIWKMKSKIFTTFSPIVKCLWGMSLLSLFIRIFLQTISVFPQISKIAFGFRPIVIGYLHLIFLGVFTTFLLGYLINKQFVIWDKYTKLGVLIFTISIVTNELILLIQGFSAILYFAIPFVSILLFAITICMFLGVVFINIPSFRR